MTLFHNDPSKGSVWNKYGGDLSATNASFAFDEMIVKEEEEGKQIALYMFATSANDVKKMKSPEWKFEPQYLVLHLHQVDWESTYKDFDGKEQKSKKKTSAQAQFYGKHLIELQKQNEGKAFKGAIDFGLREGVIDSITAGVWTFGRKEGKELTQDDILDAIDPFIKLEVIEIEKLKDQDLSVKGKGKGSGSYGQKELEKLNDRLAFLKANLGQYSESCETAFDIAVALKAMCDDDKNLYAAVSQVLGFVMGK